MRRLKYMATAGIMAAMVAITSLPVHLVYAADTSIQQVEENQLPEGDYVVPISLAGKIPLPPVATAFAKAFGETGILHVDKDGNKTLTVNNSQMEIDMSAMGTNQTFYANITSVSYKDAEGVLQDVEVKSTKESQWSKPATGEDGGPDLSQEPILTDITIPDEIVIPLVSETEGAYALSCHSDFMDNLLGYALDVTLNVDLNQATAMFGEGAARTALSAGTYQVPVKLMKEGSDMTADDYFENTTTQSMANGCIDGPAFLTVSEDGTAKMTIQLKPVSAMGQTVAASNWKIYESFDYQNAETFDCTTEVIDAEAQTSKITFTLPYKNKNGIYTTMYIAAGPGMTHSAIFAVDWKNVVAASPEEEKPDDSSTEKPDDTTTAKPDDTSTTKPDDTSTTKPDDTSTTKPADTSTTKPADTSTTKPADTSTTKPADTTTAKPADTTTTKPATTTQTVKKNQKATVSGSTYQVTATGKNAAVKFVGTSSKKTKVTIPSTVKINGVTLKVTAIADGAFKNNKTMTSVVIPATVKTIGKSAFANCTKLKSVTIPKNVTSIGATAFANCKKLAKATLGGSVKTIGAGAFQNCTALKSVVIRKNVTTIGKKAFYGAKSLKSVTIQSKKVKSVGTKAFYGINKKAVIKCHKSLTKKQKTALKKRITKSGIAKTVKVK